MPAVWIAIGMDGAVDRAWGAVCAVCQLLDRTTGGAIRALVVGGRVTLATLLTRAQISRYEQWLWFRGCTLERTVILVPDDPALAASLTRCWLPQIRAVLPLCTIRVGTPAATPTLVKHTVYRGQVTPPVAGKLDY